LADNGGTVMTSLNGTLASVSGPSMNIGGDQVTTSISVSLSYQGSGASGSAIDVLRGSAATAGGGLFLWWIAKLLSPLCGPALPGCAVGF
jgi:hypothetical protein